MKILWVMKKQLDAAMDRTVRFGMMDALSGLGDEVTLATGFRSERNDYGRGDRIRYLASSRIPFLHHVVFSAAVGRDVPRLAASIGADAVVLDAWTIEPLRAWLGSAARRSVPVIADVRTLPVNQRGWRGRMVEREFARGVEAMNSLDGVTAITMPMLQALQNDYGLSLSLPSAIWTSGVDLARFDPAVVGTQERSKLRAEMGVSDADLVVIYHGSISRERGVGELISAVAATRLPSGRRAKLLLVGGGRDTAELLREAEARGEAGAVHYVPPVQGERIPAFVSAADVGALPLPDLPGWRVSSPIKLFEYLAMGKPVVLTDIVAHRAVADGLDAAFFSASSEPAALARTIEAVAALPETRRAELAVAARQRAAASYSWDAQARVVHAFLAALQSPAAKADTSR